MERFLCLVLSQGTARSPGLACPGGTGFLGGTARPNPF